MRKIVFIFALFIISLFARTPIEFYSTKTCSFNTIEKNQIKFLYLLKVNNINNQFVIPLLSKDEEENELFSETIIEKSSHTLRAYWLRLIFTSRAVMPKQFDKNYIDDLSQTCYITYSENDNFLIKNDEWKSLKIKDDTN